MSFRALKFYVAGRGDTEGLIIESDVLDTPIGQVSIYEAKAMLGGNEEKVKRVGTFSISDLIDALQTMQRADLHKERK